MTVQLHHGDCLDVMSSIPDGSIDLILADPPYGTVKGIASGDGVEHGMKGRTKWDDKIDTENMYRECRRVLRPNGGLLLFAQEPYTSELISGAMAGLPFSYRMTWIKDHFANALVARKAPVSYTEDVCAFFRDHVKHDYDGFHPLRPYADRFFEFIGRSKKKVFVDMGHQGMCHFMRHNSTQFSLCTEKTYRQAVSLYRVDKMSGFVDFDGLSVIDSNYREVLLSRMTEENPKVFNLPKGEKYKSNVLRFKKDYTGHHPTQKPVALITDLIMTYTNEGETVLDFVFGSGTTGIACQNTGRDFIGIEKDEAYFRIAKDRLDQNAMNIKEAP